jgi:hypothetical protein
VSLPIIRPLSAERLYNAARAANNAKRARGQGKVTARPASGSAGRVSHTTNQPTDGYGNRSPVDGRFTCVTVFLHLDSDSRRAFPRYCRLHGISHIPVEQIGGFTSAADVAGIDGKRDPVSGEWMLGEALSRFLSQPFVKSWQYRTNARTPMIGSGACGADTLSPAKQRELRQPASGLRRYDLQPAYKRDVKSDAPDRDVSQMSDGRDENANAVLSVLVPLMIAVNMGAVPEDMAGELVELVQTGAVNADTVLAEIVPMIAPSNA